MVGGFALFYISGCKKHDNECDSFYAKINQVGIDELEVVDVNGQGTYAYKWSNGVGNFPKIKAELSGKYSVTVTDLITSCETSTYYDFKASSKTSCGSDTTVTDADGNSYKVVSIGNQCWMASNLLVSAGIPQVKDSATWVSTTSPAWCNYNNTSNSSIGKLYNWYAVQSGKLCPSGWHIPTYADWQVLENFLGNEPAGKMKSTAGWDSPNTAASNSSGFNALPAGYRVWLDSHFIGLGQTAGFWTSTQSNSMARFIALTYDSGWFINLTASSKQGYSCRCIKD